MNKQQAKALFFAQYWGQTVAFILDKGYNVTSVPYTLGISCRIDETVYLLLRSVDELTDQERTVVGEITFPDLIKTDFRRHMLAAGKEIIGKQQIGYAVYNYLQRIGTITPFTYLNSENKPATLQPDEIIKLGWAKLG